MSQPRREVTTENAAALLEIQEREYLPSRSAVQEAPIYVEATRANAWPTWSPYVAFILAAAFVSPVFYIGAFFGLMSHRPRDYWAGRLAVYACIVHTIAWTALITTLCLVNHLGFREAMMMIWAFFYPHIFTHIV